MAPSIELPEPERALFESLNRHNVRFLIVGLGSAALQGVHVATEDIDIWVEQLGAEAFHAAVKDAGAIYIPPGPLGQNPPMLGPERFQLIDLVSSMHGLDDFDSEYRRSLPLRLAGIELKLLPLDRIIVRKKAADRDKDRAVLPVLEAALAVIRDLEKGEK